MVKASDQSLVVRGSSRSLRAMSRSKNKESLVMVTSSRVVWRWFIHSYSVSPVLMATYSDPSWRIMICCNISLILLLNFSVRLPVITVKSLFICAFKGSHLSLIVKKTSLQTSSTSMFYTNDFTDSWRHSDREAGPSLDTNIKRRSRASPRACYFSPLTFPITQRQFLKLIVMRSFSVMFLTYFPVYVL